MRNVKKISGINNIHCLGVYLQEIEKIPLLSFEEEINLAKKIERGDREAKDKLVQANLKLVVWVAKTIVRNKTRNKKQPLNKGLVYKLPDLIQEGNKGLIKAAEKFDWRKGNRFSTYAVWWIKQAILRAIDKEQKNISFPSVEPEKGLLELEKKFEIDQVTSNIYNLLTPRQREVLSMRLEGYTLQEIGQKFGITRERVRQILKRIINKAKSKKLAKRLRRE